MGILDFNDITPRTATPFTSVIDSSRLVEGSHYTVTTNPGGVTRNANNQIVLSCSGANPTTVISLKPMLGLPFFYVSAIFLEVELVSTAQDRAGTTNTYQNTRAGVRHYVDGFTPLDVTPKWSEAHIGASTAPYWLVSIAKYDGTTWTRAVGQTNTTLSDLGTLSYFMYHGGTTTVPQIAANSYEAWGSAADGSRGAATAGTNIGMDYSTETESGDVELYVAQGDVGSADMQMTVKRMFFRDFVGKLHP